MSRSTSIRMAVLGVLALAASGARAQAERGPLELTAFAGYDLNSNVGTSGGYLYVDHAPSYGAALDYAIRPGSRLELLWVYSSTRARFVSASLSYPNSQEFGVDSHYLQVGGANDFGRGRVVPFLSGTIGAAVFVPDAVTFGDGRTASPGDTWRFAFTLGGGVKFHLSQKLGIRLTARFQAPVYFSGGAFYAGGGGSGLAVTGGIPYYQGDFTAGLMLSP